MSLKALLVLVSSGVSRYFGRLCQTTIGEGTNSMKIWFLILSLVDCIVCPTEKPSIHYSVEDAAMEIGRYKNIKQVDLFEFDSTTRTIKKVLLTFDTEPR